MTGVLVVGHKLFDFTDGIERAIDHARSLAGGKAVGVNGGITSQCLDARRGDEVWIDLVPVLLGGTRFFDQLRSAPVELEGPVSVVQGTDVTRLRYRVRYP